MFAVRDGRKLYYEDTGGDGPPALLIHGWCCDHTYFAPQVEHLRQRFRVITVDLRGHGQSDQADVYTMPAMAEDLDWLAGELGLGSGVIIGHSMGGVVALELAARRGSLATIALDSPLLIDMRGMRSVVAQLSGADYLPVALRFCEGMFMATDDAARKAEIVAQMTSTPQAVMAAAMEQLISHDVRPALEAATAPFLYVGSLVPGINPRDLKKVRPDAVIAQTAAAGHFHQLEVPEQVNPMIDRFLAVNGLG